MWLNVIQKQVNLKNVLLLNPKNDEAIYMLTLINIEKSDYNKAKELIDKFNLVCKSFCSKKEEIEAGKVEVEKILTENNSYLSCVINNAGIALGGPVRYLDVDIFRKQFEVNFFGLIEVTKCFMNLLIEIYGNILLNSFGFIYSYDTCKC